jgi:hypothetical protein
MRGERVKGVNLLSDQTSVQSDSGLGHQGAKTENSAKLLNYDMYNGMNYGIN